MGDINYSLFNINMQSDWVNYAKKDKDLAIRVDRMHGYMMAIATLQHSLEMEAAVIRQGIRDYIDKDDSICKNCKYYHSLSPEHLSAFKLCLKQKGSRRNSDYTDPYSMCDNFEKVNK